MRALNVLQNAEEFEREDDVLRHDRGRLAQVHDRQLGVGFQVAVCWGVAINTIGALIFGRSFVARARGPCTEHQQAGTCAR